MYDIWKNYLVASGVMWYNTYIVWYVYPWLLYQELYKDQSSLSYHKEMKSVLLPIVYITSANSELRNGIVFSTPFNHFFPVIKNALSKPVVKTYGLRDNHKIIHNEVILRDNGLG